MELRRKLRRKGAPSGWTEEVLEQLTDNGLIDDERAAFELARWYSLGGQRGPRKVDQLLMKRGFGATQRSQAIERAREELSLDDRICTQDLLLAKFPDATSDGLTAKARAKARRYLLGKGYDPRIIHTVLDGCPRLREDDAEAPPWAEEEFQ